MKITEQKIANAISKVAAKMRKYRLDKAKLSQAEVARRMDVRRQYIDKIESGKYNFGVETYLKFCFAVDADPGIEPKEKKTGKLKK